MGNFQEKMLEIVLLKPIYYHAFCASQINFACGLLFVGNFQEKMLEIFFTTHPEYVPLFEHRDAVPDMLNKMFNALGE